MRIIIVRSVVLFITSLFLFNQCTSPTESTKKQTFSIADVQFTDGVDYDSDGYYEIVSIAAITSPNDSTKILAEKKLSAKVKAFNTWTQTTRSEFAAPWSSTGGDASDGLVNWVTWLDSCPIDEDEGASSGTGMHWDEDAYDTKSDSLKLGYWDNFDEDIA